MASMSTPSLYSGPSSRDDDLDTSNYNDNDIYPPLDGVKIEEGFEGHIYSPLDFVGVGEEFEGQDDWVHEAQELLDAPMFYDPEEKHKFTCENCGTGTSTQGNLNRHKLTACPYSDSRLKWWCSQPGCNYRHRRKDKMLLHCRQMGHDIESTQATDEQHKALIEARRVSSEAEKTTKVRSPPTATEISRSNDSRLDDNEEAAEVAYERCIKRLVAAVHGQPVVTNGQNLSRVFVIQLMEELAATPLTAIRLGAAVSQSPMDLLKGSIENIMGEQWDWWPLAPRKYALDPSCKRLFWSTPCGHEHHVDIPRECEEPILAALSDTSSFPRSQNPSSAQHPSTGGYNGPQTPSAGSSRTTSTQLQHQPGWSSAGSVPTQPQYPIATVAPAKQNTAERHYVYLCVNRGGNYRIPAIELSSVTMDKDFFVKLKDKYLQARGILRRIFSMWRYSHCDFYELRKHPFGTGEPAQIDYPEDSNAEYDFDPRPIAPCPPLGPILECEFRQYFDNPYLATPYQPCSWRIGRQDRLLDRMVDRKAIHLLPKKKQEVHFDDGERLQFWGLYAVERRAFAWLAVYGFLLNLPGIVFFFLWLFAWRHEADLQNASVPITISLTLSVTFLALVYESREGKRS